MLRTRNCKQKQKSHFGRFHYLALCDFFGTTHKISSRYKTLSSFVQILAILRFLNKISRLFRKWCEKHKKAVIARFYAVKSWRHKRSGFCVAKMCCEPLGEAKSTTHAVRLLVGQTLKAPSLAEGVGGGYFVAKIPQTPRHHTPQNVSVSQNLPQNSLKIQLPQFLECVK